VDSRVTALPFGKSIRQDKDPQTLKMVPGPNPTTSIYNASVVNVYNTMGSLARFKNTNILFYFKKRSSLQRWRCSCKFKSRRIGSRGKFFESEVGDYRNICAVETVTPSSVGA
jgi:hypothetical protein